MTVYLEYAIVQNLLFDSALLTLALSAAKCRCKGWRVALSACVGTAFALLFPFFVLPEFLKAILKMAVGFLLCLLACSRIKTKREWKRFLVCTALFFTLTFAFGGAILGITGAFMPTVSKDNSYEVDGLSPFLVTALFSLLCFCAAFLIKALYTKREMRRFVYSCRLFCGKKRINIEGFFDSGNLAKKEGLPVCFVTPDIFFDLAGGYVLSMEEGGQICDEMQIHTLSGRKKLPVCKGEIECESKAGQKQKRQVYFASSPNMIAREYKLLINADLFKEQEDEVY